MSVVSLSQSTLPIEDENTVNEWYHAAISVLEEKHNKLELRLEQFKRKRAMLRVEYWSKMDKVRNNATPTVIGCTPHQK